MNPITIKSTNNPSIVKFELDENIAGNQSFEYKNIDEATNSPLAKQLFYLPFVKTVYIASNFIAIEKYNIVEWEEVQNEVAKQISNYIESGATVVTLSESKKQVITVYAESTPNPAVTKFVCNKIFSKTMLECKSIDDALPSPLAKALFNFPFVKEVFIVV